MKRVMLLAAALLLCAGVAYAQPEDGEFCTVILPAGAGEGDTVTLVTFVNGSDTWEDYEGNILSWIDIYEAGFGMPRDGPFSFELTADILASEGWHIEFPEEYDWGFWQNEGDDRLYDTFGDAVADGGFGPETCDWVALAPALPFVWIEGGLSTRESGDAVVLEANLSDNWASTDTPTYQWTGPGGDLGTADTEDLGNVAPGDAGLYTVTANDGEDDFTDGFMLYVIGAVPLAGGLGLGLLAGACALAATVVIRRKK